MSKVSGMERGTVVVPRFVSVEVWSISVFSREWTRRRYWAEGHSTCAGTTSFGVLSPSRPSGSGAAGIAVGALFPGPRQAGAARSCNAGAQSSTSMVPRACAGTRLVQVLGLRRVDFQTFIVEGKGRRVATLLSGNHIQNER